MPASRSSRRGGRADAGGSRRGAEREVDHADSRQTQRVQQSYGYGNRANGRSQRRHSPGPDEEEEEEHEEDGSQGDVNAEEDGEMQDASAGEDSETDYRRSDIEGQWQLPRKFKKMPISENQRKMAEKISSADQKRKANDLVRLAMFNEHRRVPTKRDDIMKKVLGKDFAKIFPIIFNRAQKVLRHTYGYEMVEIRARGMDNDQIVAAVAAQSQRRSSARNADKDETAAKKAPASSKSYIVVSILPPGFVARLTAPDPNLEEAFQDDAETTGRDPKGVLLDWERNNSELGSAGLTFLILSFILLAGRVLADDRLRSFLRRFSLLPSGSRDRIRPLPPALQPGANSRTHEGDFTIEDYLSMLIKQDYLERTRVSSAQASTAATEGRRTQVRGQVGRNRKSNGDHEQMEEFEWRWGARAEAEISEAKVAAFVADVFMSVDDDGDLDELCDSEEEEGEADAGDAIERQDEDSLEVLRKRRKAQLQRDIERAAGSALIV